MILILLDMKKNYLFVAMATLAALTVLGCKNGNKSQETAQEEIQEQKLEVADSVLAMIDEFEAEFVKQSDNAFRISELLSLTDSEKLLKPDYLLDPSAADNFVTRSQKINALAYYTLECGVRDAYDMPLDEVKEVIAKLSLELNIPIDLEYFKSDAPESEKISSTYELCKQRGDIAAFWQFHCAFIFHTDYIIASNPKLYIPKISEEGLKQFNLRLEYVNDAATALAPYDQEMAALLKEIKEWDLLAEPSDWDEAFATESTTAQFYIVNKQAIIDRRNRMLSN